MEGVSSVQAKAGTFLNVFQHLQGRGVVVVVVFDYFPRIRINYLRTGVI